MCRMNMTLINRSANFKPSTFSDHVATDRHSRTVKEKDHEDSISTGDSTHPEKTFFKNLPNSLTRPHLLPSNSKVH